MTISDRPVSVPVVKRKAEGGVERTERRKDGEERKKGWKESRLEGRGRETVVGRKAGWVVRGRESASQNVHGGKGEGSWEESRW